MPRCRHRRGGGPRGASRAAVDGYLHRLADLHKRLSAEELYETAEVVVSAGGSAYFDRVAEILGPLAGDQTRVVLRAGAYLVHDDGFYREVTPSTRGARAGVPLGDARLGARGLAARTGAGT